MVPSRWFFRDSLPPPPLATAMDDDTAQALAELDCLLDDVGRAVAGLGDAPGEVFFLFFFALSFNGRGHR